MPYTNAQAASDKNEESGSIRPRREAGQKPLDKVMVPLCTKTTKYLFSKVPLHGPSRSSGRNPVPVMNDRVPSPAGMSTEKSFPSSALSSANGTLYLACINAAKGWRNLFP
jgi:hypothetical protein